MKKQQIIWMSALLVMFLSFQKTSMAQSVSGGINFQAIARDSYSNPAKDRKIFVEASIIQTSTSGTVVLKEKFETLTDATGVFSIVIGRGTRLSGTAANLESINWANGPFFLGMKVAIAPIAPVDTWDYTKDLVDLGTTSLGSVPYALYAGNVAGFDTKLNITDTTKMLSSYARVANLNSLVTNKVNVADSITKYVTPTQLASKTFDSTAIYNQLGLKANSTDVTTSLNLKENTSNKSIDVTADGASDSKYPSAKAVKSYVDTQIAGATIADANATTKGKLQLAGDLTGTAAAPTITNNAITTTKINDGAVTTAKISDANVTDAKIVSVSGSKVVGNITGNAATATKIATPVTINGVSFDGSSNITISSAAANALTMNNSGSGDNSGTTFDGSAAKTISYNTIGASPLAGSSSLTTVGTITSGTWNGNTISVANGGTGQTTLSGVKQILGLNTRSLALATDAGKTNQGDLGIALGAEAGLTNQGGQSIAIGSGSGRNDQGASAIAIGYVAGDGTQGTNAIAIGSNAAQSNQASQAVAIGYAAGQNGQGANAVAIGAFSGNNAQAANSIAINGTGTSLNPVYAGLYIDPIRNATTPNTVFYNPTSKEITYGIGDGVNSIGNIGVTSNAKGATISGTTISLTPADASNGGIITTGSQTFAGSKTFNNDITAPNFLGNATTATTAGNITATSNTSLTSIANLTEVGTITTGTWNGTTIEVGAGGTGLSTIPSGYIPFGQGSSPLGTSANLFWDNSNNSLGIGTSNPGSGFNTKLDVKGNSSFRTTNTNKAIKIDGDLSSNYARIYTDATVGSADDLVLGTYPNGHMNQLFLKQSNGFVGIRKTNPTTALDVNGTVTAAGFSGPLTGDVTGNASTATIAGNITATSNTSLTSLANLISVGTITTGVWSGTAIAIANGGTGATSASDALTNLGAEAVANKSTDIDMGGNGASNSKYPSQLAVKTYVSNQFASGGVADNSITNAKLYGGITASKLVGTDISTVGTITSGTWNASTLTVPYGGTGATSLTGYVKGNGTFTMTASTTIPVADVTGAEASANKSDNTSLGTSTTLYPTQNAVKSYVDTKVAAATIADADATTKGKLQLAGDLGNTAASPSVVSVGGSTAANIHTAELAANAATDANTVSTIVKRNSAGDFSAGTITANLSGNASTATILQNSRNINGVAFNGSTDITIAADANTLTGTSLASNITSSSLTTLGTITSGTWSASTIGITKGGTGLTSVGSSGQVLSSNGTSMQWTTPLSAAITSLNGSADASQSFATPGTSGTAPSWSSASGVHTLNIPMASANAVTAGLLSNTDFADFSTAFTNRINSLTVSGTSGSATLNGNVLNIPTYSLVGLGGIDATAISATAPLTYTTSGTASGTIGINQAGTSSDGYLSSADWNKFNNKIDNSKIGITTGSGVASLVDGKIPSSQIPAVAFQSVDVVTSDAAMQALSNASVGSIAINTTTNKNYVLSATPAATLANWIELASPNSVTSVNGFTGPNVSLTSDNINEGSNNKYYLDSRARAAIALTTTGTGAATYSSTSGQLNIPTYSLPIATSSSLGGVKIGNNLTIDGNGAISAVASTTLSGTLNRIEVTNSGSSYTANISPSYIGQNSITTLGTISTGTWSGTTIALANGGTGATSASAALSNLGAEPTANKNTATDLGGSSPSDILFPSQKAAKTYIDQTVSNAVSSGAPDATTTATGKIQLAGDLGGTASSPTVTKVGGKLASEITTIVNAVNAATNSNTATAIVKRDASGNFSAGTITATLNGNASTATILATGRTIATTGDVSYTSASFDGSANVTGVATLANTGVVSGTYGSSTAIPSLTIDSKGRVTSATTTSIIAGVNTVGTIAGTSNANGATISGTTLTLTPADATNGGIITTGTQTIAGTKTFNSTITGSITGNAGTATTLATGRTIGITGDLTYTSPSFDGSGNITGTGTLTNTGVTQGTYGSSTAIPSLTIDAKGRITNATTTSIIAGVNTVGTIAGTSNANGATISGTTITFTPADGTNGGMVTTAAQTFAGVKTFSNNTAASSTSTGAVIVTGGLGVGGAIYGGSIQNTPIGSITANTGAFTTLAASGATTLGSTLAVNGAGTFSSTLSAGATTLSSATITNNETVGGTLGVTGATTLSSTSAHGGAATFSSTINVAGAATLSSATITNNETVGGTLGVTGATTLSSTSSHGGAATFSSTINVVGTATLATASVTGNETVGGTLGVTGATTLTALTTTGTATLSGTVNIPSNAGAGKVLISDATGNASWNSNPYASIYLITTATASTAYAADLTKKYIIYNYGTAEAGKISIPAAATANAGAEIIIKNKSANTVTITPLSGSVYIDNAITSAASVSIGIEASNNWVRLVSDGTQWIVFRALF